MVLRFSESECPFCNGKGFRVNFLKQEVECEHSFNDAALELYKKDADELTEKAAAARAIYAKIAALAAKEGHK